MPTTSACLDQQETADTTQTARLTVAAAMHNANLRSTTIANYFRCRKDALAIELTERPGCYRIVRATCKSKWCTRCSGARAARIRDALEPIMAHRQIRLITLTLRNQRDDLAGQLDRLLRCFKRLRQTRDWKARVYGGAFFVELTRNAADQTWHPHLHLICEGVYYDRADLAAAWRRATGDSYIVHITLVRDHRSIGRYVTKYLTQPIDSTTYASELDLATAIAAMHSRRTIGTFGGWTKHKLLARPKPEPSRLVGWIAELRIKADNGDQLARRLVQVYDNMPATAMAADCEIPAIVAGRIDQLDNDGPWDYAEQPQYAHPPD